MQTTSTVDAVSNEPRVERCTVLLPGGAYVTAGIAVLIERARVTEARVTELTNPGALLNHHLGNGDRQFLLRFEDGRDIAAELISTAWISSGRRMCCFILHPNTEPRSV